MRKTTHHFSTLALALVLVLVPVLATGLCAQKRPPIGSTLATYSLHPSNGNAYGLAYDGRSSPHQLYVADSSDNRIYVYKVVNLGLTYLRYISTTSLDAGFRRPRGLAIGRQGGHSYLYALTCNAPGPGSFAFDSRLWRIDLDDITASGTKGVDLNASGVALATRSGKLFDLGYYGGRVYVSYDTSAFSTRTAVSQGILKIKVYENSAPNNWWTRLGRGDLSAVESILPNSGRSTSGSTYSRAPAFGLAHMYLGWRRYLWCTSYHKYIYLADAATGRGIFYFDSPGKILGLTYGNGHLWAVDAVSGGRDQVHKINVTSNYNAPLKGPRRVRHLSMRLKSKAKEARRSMNVRHNFAVPPRNALRPNQGRDTGSEIVTPSRTATQRRRYYYPGGDRSSRQDYLRVSFSGSIDARKSVQSTYEIDFWTSDYKHLVYPHLCTRSSPPLGDYTADSFIYRMSNSASYDRFLDKLEADLRREYGWAALSRNRYWRARNIVEFIMENYDYGASIYHPASRNLDRIFEPATLNNMSCSSSAFAMIGLCRYMGIPARWVGTTKQRGGWDANGSGLMTSTRKAVDRAFHRWVEVWMGDDYGWQRFDPTPMARARPCSQWDLMRRSACGVDYKSLVLNVGSGYHAPFYDQLPPSARQRYNAVPRFGSPSKWEHLVLREITWSNACFLRVTFPTWGNYSTRDSLTVQWTTSGRWDLDPGATVSIYAYDRRTRRRKLLMSGVAWNAGSATVSLAGLANGLHQIDVIKDTDSETGGRSGLMVIET